MSSIRNKLVQYFLLLALSCVCNLFSNAQMRQLYYDSSYFMNGIKKASFYSQSQGYVCFYQSIGYTSDSGRTFTKKYVTPSNTDPNGFFVNTNNPFDYSGVFAINQNTILVYGNYVSVPSILYSTDGGNTYKVIYYSQYNGNPQNSIFDMSFPERNGIGYAVDNDRVLKSVDGGLHWNIIRDAPGSDFHFIEATSNNDILLYRRPDNDNTPVLLKSNNGGVNWQTITTPLPGSSLFSAFFLNSTTGWLSMLEKVFYTNNGGQTWRQMNESYIGYYNFDKIIFLNDSTGYGVYDSIVYKTTDTGKIWEMVPSGPLTAGWYTDLQFTSNYNQLWAYGEFDQISINTNLTLPLIPKVLFRIDTIGLRSTGLVHLINQSRPYNNTYKWYKNNILIGTGYNATYTHDPNVLKDTIKLEISNTSATTSDVKYVDFYPPVILTSFSPQTAGEGTEVTINGTNLEGTYDVSFGGIPAIFVYQESSTVVKAVVGSGASGIVKVSTTRNEGQINGFTFIPPPGITSVTPISCTAGTLVTINGINFNNVSNVYFGGYPATSFTYISPTKITAITPSGSSGNIVVMTPGGTAVKSGYIALPIINSFTPTFGTFGTHMDITGTNLSDITSVSAGGIPVQSFTIKSPNQISAIIADGNSGNVQVIKPTASFSLPGFAWFPAPKISSFSPKSGPVGTSVVITGTNFNPVAANNTVFFGTVKAVVTSGTANSLTVTVPVGANHKPISVLSNYLKAYSSVPFKVTFPNGGSIDEQAFSSRTDITVGPNSFPGYIALGDFDGDGKQDIIYSNFAVNANDETGVKILLNTSTTSTVSFGQSILLPNLGLSELAIDDYDLDGKLDFATANIGTDSLFIYRNLSTIGNLSFDTPLVLKGGGSSAELTCGDIDGDGKPEITVGGGGIRIFRNIGEPGKIAFEPGNLFLFYSTNYSLKDMDYDGKPELVTHSYGSDLIAIYKNTSIKGSISFSDPAIISAVAPIGLEAEDMDNDDKIDLIYFNSGSSRISMSKNIGNNGSFEFATPIEITNNINYGERIGISDLNGDGLLDFGFVQRMALLSLMRNVTDTLGIDFDSRTDFNPMYYDRPKDIVIGDINGDGKPDPIVSLEVTKQISIFINNSKQEPIIKSFTPTIGISGSAITIKGLNFNNITSIKFGNTPASSFTVNSPTSITAIVGNGATGALEISNNLGTDSKQGFYFGSIPVINSIQPVNAPSGTDVIINGQNFSSIAGENTVFLGSAKASVKASNNSSLTVTVPSGYSAEQLNVTVNNRTGYYDKPFPVTFSGSIGQLNASTFSNRIDTDYGGIGKVADLDGDNKAELIISYDYGVKITRNISTPGALGFSFFVTFSTGNASGIYNLAVSDFDGDGKKDIVTLNSNISSITVLKNTSTPDYVMFDTRLDITIPSYSALYTDIEVIDIDKDGRNDIILANNNGNIIVYKNTSFGGSISFKIYNTFNTNTSIKAFTIGDIDGDSYPDIAIASSGDNKVWIWKNTSQIDQPNFAQAINYPISTNLNDIKLADLDGDNKLDMILVSGSSNMGYVLKNTSTIGNIGFATKIDLPSHSNPISIDIADLDGDAKADLIFHNFASKDISLLRNNSSVGNLSFLQKNDLNVQDSALAGATVDLDGDGRIDILSRASGGHYNFFLNTTGLTVINSVCANSNTTITSNITGTTYQWQQNTGTGFVNITNNANISGATTNSLQLINLPIAWNGYEYRCNVNGTLNSVVNKLNIIGTAVTPTVSITTSTTNICTGTNVIFSSTMTNGGSSPSYQWQINGFDVGTNSPTYSYNGFKNNDIVKVILTSNATCATTPIITSNSITLSVSPIVTPDMIIEGNTIVPKGQASTITTSTNLTGPTTSYQWQDSTTSHNWANIIGGTNPTINYTPATSGDKIRCVLSSSSPCVTISSIKSNTLIFTVTQPTAIEPIPASKYGIHIFPNPVFNFIVFDSLKISDNWQSLQIINISGKQIGKTVNIINHTKVIFNTEALKPGYYVAVLKRRSGRDVYYKLLKLDN